MPTAAGWAVILLLPAGAAAWLVPRAHALLAVNQPIGAEVLVVEGWVGDAQFAEIARQFRAGAYRTIVTVGGPLRWGGFLGEHKDYASLAAATLRALGVPETAIVVLPVEETPRDRTYESARAFRRWLLGLPRRPDAIDLYSEGVHARRSRLLFRKALGETVAVGVIAGGTPGYDPERWWATSEGLKTVVYEGLAYLYARFLFHPGAP